MELNILKEDENIDLYSQAMNASKERFDGEDYICTAKEYLVLEKFLEDCKTYGDCHLYWRFYGDDGIWYDTSVTVLEAAVTTKRCRYKDSLFIVELLNEFIGRAENDESLEYLGDYQELLKYIKNRIVNKQI